MDPPYVRRGPMNAFDPRQPPDELPDAVEDRLADALLRSPKEQARRLEALVSEFPGHAMALRSRLEAFRGEAGDSVPAGIDGVASGTEQTPGQRIDRYNLLERIDEGGMGTVWLAEQREPIRRRVALKVIKPGMDTRQVLARFEAERQALARMDHPHIAKVFDAGNTAFGRPYFVMEYIRGVPILEYCEAERLGIEGRLALLIKVCQAIQHAHQKGVIHRDIKPTNVLVTLHDGVAVPKVIDFGVAKATTGTLTERTLFTAHRQVIGTPAYMAPEQAEMSGLDVDTRSDIYSLGVLLYELLTGTTPFDNCDLLTKGFVEMLRTLREVEPHKPSTRVSTLRDGARRIASPSHAANDDLAIRLRGDLDWIVMKCLEKDRTRRYATANELAADLQRHLDCEPVTAGPPGTRYRLHKFLRRNRRRVAVGVALVVVLLLGLVVSAIGWQHALDEKVRADLAWHEESLARARAEHAVGFLRDMLRGIGPSVARGRDTTMLKEMMDRAAVRIERGDLAATPEAEIQLRSTIGDLYRQVADYEAARRMLEPALRQARDLHAGDHLEVASAMGSLALLHYVEGELVEAERLHREVLAMVERCAPADLRRIAGAQGTLAVTLQARGSFEAAERLYRDSLAIRRRLFAGDHDDVAWCVQALATLLTARGENAAAEPLYLEALAMLRRLHPGDSPQVATGLGHLAILLHRRGDLEQAEAYYRESLAMNRRLYPGDHPSVATGLNALAMLLQGHGATDEATELFIESMEMSRRMFSADQPNRAVDLDALAALYLEQHDLNRAVPLLEEALAGREAKLGRDHPDTLVTTGRIGMAYLELGRVAAAIPLLEVAAGVEQEHPMTVPARHALLQSYAWVGVADPSLESEAAIGRVMRLWELERVGDVVDAETRADLLARFAAAWLGLGRWAEADRLLCEEAVLRGAGAPADWRTDLCAVRRGVSLLGLGRCTEAEPLLSRGLLGLQAMERQLPEVVRRGALAALQRATALSVESGRSEDAGRWRAAEQSLAAAGHPEEAR